MNLSVNDEALTEMTPRPVFGLRCMIVLVGLMGAGKSAIGRRMAQRLGVPFIDADTEIEKAAGATISEIFARDGEAAFRLGERRVIARLLDGPIGVIATGGGAFMDPSTRERIRARGVSIWLKADLETLVERTGRRSTRPLLAQGDARETLTRLMAIRDPIYAEADLMVESRSGPVEMTVHQVLEALAARTGPDGYLDILRGDTSSAAHLHTAAGQGIV
jgi:shikimate kinase